MGSLLPGWDESAPGVVPREFQDFKEEDEEDRPGYFARLSMSRKMKGESGTSADSAEPIPIGRRSMPLSRDSVGGRSFSKDSPGSGSFKAPPHLQRLSSLPAPHGDVGDLLGMPKTPKTPGSFAGSPKSLDAYKMARDDNRRNYQWWRHFDSAHLNEQPDVPVSKEKAYTPQYDVAGNAIQYRRAEGGAPPVVVAQ